MQIGEGGCCISQCKGKLNSTSMSGPAFDVFAKVLRGLSGARLTRPGQFKSSDDSSAVRCSYKVRRQGPDLLHPNVPSARFCNALVEVQCLAAAWAPCLQGQHGNPVALPCICKPCL